MNILGLDVGGVILDFVPYKDTDKDFGGPNYLETPEITDAIESISKLNKESRFAGNIYLVSKVKHDEFRIKSWLEKHDFFTKTGIPEDHLFTCKERADKEAIVKRLGVTHFVDDRAEILETMVGLVPNLYQFQGLDENHADYAHVGDKLIKVHDWQDLYKKLA